MHDIILKGLSSLHGLSGEQDLANFLRELRPTARYLWQAYRSSIVKISYRKPALQAAYMLRYFPYHAEVTHVVLDELYMRGVLPFQEELLHVNLFGCGPAPELCGIMKLLKSRFPRTKKLIAHLFDVASESWRYSRQIALDYLVPSIMDRNLFEAHPSSFDLTRPGSAVGFFTPIDCPNRISEASLVMFQNCLNEIPQSVYDVVIRNTLDLLRMMKAGKIMLVIDRAGYQHVMNLISRISSLAVKHSLAKVIVFDQRRTLDCTPILENMPPILAANLLVLKTRRGESTPDSDKLIGAKQVRYDCLALQRV